MAAGQKTNNTRKYLFFFAITFIVRLLFIVASGKYGYDYVKVDSAEYVDLARKIMLGDFNMDLGRFIRSPLYPIYIAAHMKLLGSHWEWGLLITQIIISCLCCIYIIKIAEALFKNQWVSFIAGVLYVVYVPTFYFTGSYTTEALYQFLYLAATYYFVLFLQGGKLIDVVKYSVLFTICYLTRSEIGIYFPFMFLVTIYLMWQQPRQIVLSIASFILIFGLLTMPWGLYTKVVNHQYITSSNGGKYVFYLSNSNVGYTDLIATPEYGSKEFKAFLNSFNAVDPAYDSMMALPTEVKQDVFLKRSLDWIKANPGKFVQIKLMSLFRFFTPGVSWKHHPFKSWIASFMIGFPLYLMFYIGLFLAVRRAPREHLWFIGKFISTVIFVVIFLFTERFRAYSIEPFFLIYASFALYELVGKRFIKTTELPAWLS